MALRLPAELWDHVLLQLDPDELQHTTLALSRALGNRVSISRAVWWRHLAVTRQGQAWQCIQQLRNEPQGTRVESLTVQLWREDQQLLVNLALAPPLESVRALSLTVGPLAAPEHVQDLLDPVALRRNPNRFRKLEQLAFRFNPYCQERSYYTFLKVRSPPVRATWTHHTLTCPDRAQGAYFDVAPLALAAIGTSEMPQLRRLSFIQDLPPTHGSVKKETPAFGLPPQQQLEDGMAGLDLQGAGGGSNGGNEDGAESDPEPAPVQIAGKYVGKRRKGDKMDFAQPIVSISAMSRRVRGSDLS